MSGPRGYYFLSEINQIKTNTVWYHLYVESKKKKKPEKQYNELIHRTETDTQTMKTN